MVSGGTPSAAPRVGPGATQHSLTQPQAERKLGDKFEPA